jgi:hypothetical protein
MSTLSFFRPMLEALNDGKIIRSTVVWSIKALALLILAGGVYLLVDIIKASSNMPTEGTFGAIIFAAVLLGSIFVIAQIFLHRAKNIGELQEGPPFLMIRVCSMLLRGFGEAYATLLVGVGAGGCVFLWLAKDNPLYYVGELAKFLPAMGPEPTLLGGVFFLGYYMLMSFVAFVVSYFLSESIVVMADIAKTARHSFR